MDRNPEIAEYIRTGVMKYRLSEELAYTAVATALRRVDACSAKYPLPAHRAHNLMQITTHIVVKDKLREAVMRSKYLNNLLQEHAESREEWYEKAAQGPASLAMFQLRRRFTKTYGFPVITPEAVHLIRDSLADRPALEVGAGNGYLESGPESPGWEKR